MIASAEVLIVDDFDLPHINWEVEASTSRTRKGFQKENAKQLKSRHRAGRTALTTNSMIAKQVWDMGHLTTEDKNEHVIGTRVSYVRPPKARLKRATL